MNHSKVASCLMNTPIRKIYEELKMITWIMATDCFSFELEVAKLTACTIVERAQLAGLATISETFTGTLTTSVPFFNTIWVAKHPFKPVPVLKPEEPYWKIKYLHF